MTVIVIIKQRGYLRTVAGGWRTMVKLAGFRLLLWNHAWVSLTHCCGVALLFNLSEMMVRSWRQSVFRKS
jgi:hypothetical protein